MCTSVVTTCTYVRTCTHQKMHKNAWKKHWLRMRVCPARVTLSCQMSMTYLVFFSLFICTRFTSVRTYVREWYWKICSNKHKIKIKSLSHATKLFFICIVTRCVYEKVSCDRMTPPALAVKIRFRWKWKWFLFIFVLCACIIFL